MREEILSILKILKSRRKSSPHLTVAIVQPQNTSLIHQENSPQRKHKRTIMNSNKKCHSLIDVLSARSY
jgi:C4-type Zn-finger protein